MTVARLFADENFSFPAVVTLRRLGHDVATVQEVGLGNQRLPDLRVLEHAIADRRCVVTFNRRHFLRLHSEQPAHCGIVISTMDIDGEDLGQRIHEAICGYESLNGQLIRVYRPPG